VILAKVDVKVALPQTLINFVLRQLAGVFLYQLQQKAIKVSLRALHTTTTFLSL
jgi:hypothetical protein